MRRRAYGASVLFTVAVTSYWLGHISSLRTPPREVVAGDVPLNDTGLPPLAGVYETLEGVELVFEVPASHKAILLLFHGCKHSSTDWWPKSEKCTNCTGLPEEVRIIEAALAEGYIVVALSSQDRVHSRCWDTGWPPELSIDIQKVTWAVQALVKRQGWSGLPVYALGGSSGGALVMLLALRMQLQGVCCQIMAVPPDVVQTKPQDEAGNTWQYPPTALVYMAKDQHTAQGVGEMSKALAEQGIPVLGMVVHPQPLTPAFFSSRTRVISAALSSAIYATFLRAGLLDASGYLLEDPRLTSTQWQPLLEQNVPVVKDMNLKVEESAIHEELNLAWAEHELVSDNISSVLNFFHSSQPAKIQRAQK